MYSLLRLLLVFVNCYCSFLQFSGEAIAFYSGEEPEKKETKRRLGWVVTNFNYLIKWEASVTAVGFNCVFSLEWCYDSYDQIISRLVDLLHALGHGAGRHQCSSPFIRICRCDRCDPALPALAEPFTNGGPKTGQTGHMSWPLSAGKFFPYLMMAPAYLRGEIESLSRQYFAFGD